MTTLDPNTPLSADEREALIKQHEYDELIFGGFVCTVCTPNWETGDDPDDNVDYPCPPLRAAGVTNEEAVLIIKLGRAQVEITARRSDSLNIRGILSPNGSPRRVPKELGEDLAPAVEWLVNEVDRLNKAVGLLGSHLQGGAQAAKDLARVIDVTALEIRRAVRLANAGDHVAAMNVITEWADEADWLDNLNDEENFHRPSAPTVEQEKAVKAAEAEVERLTSACMAAERERDQAREVVKHTSAAMVKVYNAIEQATKLAAGAADILGDVASEESVQPVPDGGETRG